MKHLQVIKIEATERVTLKNATLLLDNLVEPNKIETVSWKEFPYKPKVEFRMGYAEEIILLKFQVTEKAVGAKETRINGKVHLDSCVEFFFSTDGVAYYNFEFNCIGTPHAAWGKGRENRQYLPEEVIRQIQVKSTLGTQPIPVQQGNFSWELCVLLPGTCLMYDPGVSLEGLSGHANFYKCGDDLPDPHFLSWNPVGTPQPDFHRPEFFGKIDFE